MNIASPILMKYIVDVLTTWGSGHYRFPFYNRACDIEPISAALSYTNIASMSRVW